MARLYLLLFGLLAACGGREALPVAVSNSFDSQLSCDHLASEKAANRRRVVDLVGERAQRDANNVGMLLVSPLFLDLSGTVKEELRAIEQRDARLDQLMAAKSCPPVPPAG